MLYRYTYMHDVPMYIYTHKLQIVINDVKEKN